MAAEFWGQIQGPARNRTSKMQICLEGHGAGPLLLAISKVSRTKDSTQLKVFMTDMKPEMCLCVYTKPKTT